MIMDVNMPRMNGVTATRHITREWSDIKVIGLSYDSSTTHVMMETGGEEAACKAKAVNELTGNLHGNGEGIADFYICPAEGARKLSGCPSGQNGDWALGDDEEGSQRNCVKDELKIFRMELDASMRDLLS